MKSEREWLGRWSRLAGIEPPAREPGDLAGLFAAFGPMGDGVGRLFDDIPGGAEVHRRLESVYRASADALQPTRAYVAVASRTQVPADAVAKARRWIESLGAVLSSDAELSQILRRARVEWQESDSQPEVTLHPDDDPLVWLFDAVSDVLRRAADRDSPLLLLRDAAYSIAGDLYLATYVLWPLYKRRLDCHDPFRPYFELWASGLELHFVDESTCLVREVAPSTPLGPAQ